MTNKNFVDSVRIIAVIPACNEERTIGSVVIKACTQVDTVIVLDLGSDDATGAIAAAAGAVVVEQADEGSGIAPLAVALLKAREFDPDAVITLEGEWKHLLDDVNALISPVLHEEADLVVGQHVFAPTRVVSQSLRSVCRVYSPQALDVFSLIPVAFERSSEINRVANDYSLNVVNVPIEIRPAACVGHDLLSAGRVMFNLLITSMKQDRRLFLFAALGVASIALSVLVGLVMLGYYAFSGHFSATVAAAELFVLLAGIGFCVIGFFLYGLRVVAHRSFSAVGANS